MPQAKKTQHPKPVTFFTCSDQTSPYFGKPLAIRLVVVEGDQLHLSCECGEAANLLNQSIYSRYVCARDDNNCSFAMSRAAGDAIVSMCNQEKTSFMALCLCDESEEIMYTFSAKERNKIARAVVAHEYGCQCSTPLIELFRAESKVRPITGEELNAIRLVGRKKTSAYLEKLVNVKPSHIIFEIEKSFPDHVEKEVAPKKKAKVNDSDEAPKDEVDKAPKKSNLKKKTVVLETITSTNPKTVVGKSANSNDEDTIDGADDE
jgi:hypothetical protein